MAAFGCDAWTGTWELASRENWDVYLEFTGVPAEIRAEVSGAADYHKYRVDKVGFTMDHQIPEKNMHLHFRADLDGQWTDSPYPKPTVGLWAADGEHATPTWRNSWLEEPVCFKSEIPNFMGKEGNTVTIERRLISPDEIKMTLHVCEGSNIVVGPCWTTMRKISPNGPAPLAWLRARGKPIKTAEGRHEALEQVFKMMSDSENIDAFSDAQEKDRVCPPRFDGSAKMLLGGCKFYQGLVPQWMTPEQVEDTCPPPLKNGVDAECTIVNEPKGVGIVIVPWNAPVTLAFVPMLGMLAAGNHVVVKPSELTPNTSAVIRRLCHKYLHGYVWVEEGAVDAVNRLIDEAADHLVFTGGASIAKIVAARCAQVLTPVTLELGGKSPVFIDRGLQDSMLNSAVREILETKVYKTGQFCCAHDYALVHEEIHDAFCAKLRAAIEALGPKRNVPLIGRRQYEGLKQKLLDAGCECLPPLDGTFAPNDDAMTLPFCGLLSPAMDNSLLTSEIFGPIMPILKVKDVHEAASLVSGPREKPLIAYCYSEDPVAVNAFLCGTQSGNLAVNSGPMRMHLNFNGGFGGIGPSGSGVSMWGREALREFSNRRSVIRAQGGFAQSYFSGPPS